MESVGPGREGVSQYHCPVFRSESHEEEAISIRPKQRREQLALISLRLR
jgi:hypothetical protein